MKTKPVDYLQTDPRWRKISYTTHDNHQTIGNSGSGPTIAADLVATFIDPDITPVDMANLALEWDCRTYNTGTSWGYYPKVAQHFNFQKFIQTKDFEQVMECIDSGGLVIASVGKGYWTRGSTFVLVWNYDDKNVYCNDSCSHMKTKQSITNFKSESRMYFCYYPSDKTRLL